MSFDGNGNYSLPAGNPVVTATSISSTWANTTLPDIATALTNCVTRDGQSPATAAIPMGSNKITGLASGTAKTDAANIGDAQGGAFAWCATAGGTANALTLTPSPAITAYAAGQKFVFTALNTNGAATTVAVSGLSTIAVQWNQAACVGGEIVAGKIYEIYLDSATTCQVRPFCFDAYGLSDTHIFGAAGVATASRAVVLDASKNIGTLGTVTATAFSGPLTGAVTGNVTGNCSGSSGSCTGNAASATTAGTITSQGALATLNQLANNTQLTAATAGNYLDSVLYSFTATGAGFVGAAAKASEMIIPRSGTFRTLFRATARTGNSTVQIYKNGVAFGTSHVGPTVGTWYTEDLAFAAGDLIQVYDANGASGDSITFDFAIASAQSIIGGALYTYF